MNYNQKNFYKETLAIANQAILKREHESAIASLEDLKRGQYKDLSDIDRGLVNNKIIQAKKKIKFLDQPGQTEYWESKKYGYQWFDQQGDSFFKVFFAYSKKCKNPLITFRYYVRDTSKIVRTVKVKPRANVSTITVPYYGSNSLGVDDFRCN